ncbi:hypothetical protein [Wenyingzhuangia heitensis]|uniref:hypothetical protein n=1 Tax=Wenyingzhuangia heitensis TaxID=1487859 RepID=UPI00293BE097|nr:hypothetical protein [Wenyingzhuangia heitensis]
MVAQLIDKHGNEVKNTEDQITFKISGEHRFLGTDCGDSTKLNGFNSKTVNTNFG